MSKIRVNEVIDQSKFNRFHLMVVFLCTLIIVFDGYDLVVYGTVVPLLMKEWSISPIQAGVIGSYALFGLMLGALFFGPLADKVGRKGIIIFCSCLFSVCMGAAALAQGPTQFGIFRFIAGIGLGGVMPNVTALMTEYSPRTLRTTLIAIVINGISVGGIITAGLGMALLPSFGWRTLFFIGLLPLLAIPFLIKYLPETAEFYLIKNRKQKLYSILKKVNPEYKVSNNDDYELTTSKTAAIPVISLFKNHRTLSTILFWITVFMSLLMVYGLNTWLPKLMVNAGYTLGSSLWFLLTFNIGSILGAVVGAYLIDRMAGKKVLAAFYLIAAIAILLLSVKVNIVLLTIIVVIAGATTSGTQIVAIAYVSQFYPTEIRATGVGWTLGIGRIGAILGPIIGGVLLSMKVPLSINFIFFAIPGLIAAIAISFAQIKYSDSQLNKVGALKKSEEQNAIAQ